MTMAMESENTAKRRPFSIAAKLGNKIDQIVRQSTKIAKDDPRKLIHSLKVGLALTLVSLFYYFQPLYSNFGESAMWAVMTVVVVFEFSVGATLGKGINRGLATLLAGALGLGAHHLASASGKTCQPVLIGVLVFIQAVASTFIRFFPTVKARYDYGILIFILTFSLVSISGLQTNEILDFAQKRLSTIFIGASTCVMVSILVCPVWAGEDLHLLVAQNIDKLGTFLENFSSECFKASEREASKKERSSLVSLTGIIDSKSNSENLENFAKWEPGHGRFKYRHPWKQYVKIADLTRECACRVEALSAYLNSRTDQQAPEGIMGMIEEAFSKMSSESGKALKELALAMETMTKPPVPNHRIASLKTASKKMESLLKFELRTDAGNLLQIMPAAAAASLLIDAAIHVEHIAEAVSQLSSLANFKPMNADENGIPVESAKKNLKQVGVDETSSVIIQIDGAAILNKPGVLSSSA